ncbi:MAG: hypothetical protein AAF599_14485, partial [Bacteroidota bacterium]
ENGADPTLVDTKGFNLIEYAASEEYLGPPEILELLLNTAKEQYSNFDIDDALALSNPDKKMKLINELFDQLLDDIMKDPTTKYENSKLAILLKSGLEPPIGKDFTLDKLQKKANNIITEIPKEYQDRLINNLRQKPGFKNRMLDYLCPKDSDEEKKNKLRNPINPDSNQKLG